MGIDPKKSLMLVGLIVIIVGVAVFMLKSPGGAPVPGTQTPGAEGEGVHLAAPGGGQVATPKPTTGSAPKPSSVKSGIAVLSPAADNRWVVGELHTISWSRAADISGGMSLLNADTKEVVGWINSNLGGGQTSFAWDTQSVFLARNSGYKKNIDPGRYIIKIQFDGNLASIQSAPFSVIYPSQVQFQTHVISLSGALFSPKTTTVTRGDLVVFTNKDNVPYRINMSIFDAFTLEPGASYTFKTQQAPPDSYEFYSEAYPTLRGTLIVK